MPIYEYECPECGYWVEVLTNSRDNPEEGPDCEDCKQHRHNVVRCVKVPISKTSFILKGGGWAATGYSKKPKDAK